MSKQEFSWLCLEPFVHGVVKNNHVLLYNTLNKTHLIFNDNIEIAEIVAQLIDPSNGYVCPVTIDQQRSPGIQKFIDQLRKKYMGDIYQPEWSDSKPFNLTPEPIVKKGEQKLEQQLHEITFHLNTRADNNLKLFKDAAKQFTFPLYSAGQSAELSFEIIQSVANQIINLPFATINFTGSNIFNASTLEKLNAIFKGTSFRRKFHIPLFQLEKDQKILLKKHDWLSLYITFPIDPEKLEILGDLLRNKEAVKRIEFYFIILDGADVDMAIGLISDCSITHTFFKPFFSGENMQFFKDNVFISAEDLQASQPSQKQIFSRISMNENDYGKLIILPDGKVFANMNDEPLGNVTVDSIETLLQKELSSGKSWLRRRTMVEPCKNCIFHFLCPPISNYEIYLNRFNFCHIYS